MDGASLVEVAKVFSYQLGPSSLFVGNCVILSPTCRDEGCIVTRETIELEAELTKLLLSINSIYTAMRADALS